MQNTSSAFKTAIKAPARILKIRATIQAPDLTVYNLTMEDLAQGGFSYKAACMEHDFSLGGATAASCTLVLTNYDKQWDDVDFEGGKLTVFCGVVTGYEVPEPDEPEEPEEEMPEPEPVPIIEDVLMGTFVIDRQSRPYATITLSAADRLILLDKPLADVPGVIYPVTARTLLTAISGACNVPLDNSLLDIDELDEIDLHEPEYDGVTCRDVLGEIALLCGGFARCTREGAIEIVKITQPETETAYVLTKNDRFSFRETTEPITLTGLKYGDTLIGDEGYILEVERLYMMPEDLALTHLQALWMDFEGFTYTPCTAQYMGNPAIDTGDHIKHVTRADKEVLTFVGKHTFTFGGRCSIDSYGKSKSEQKYISANTRRLSGLVAGITHDFDQKLSDYEQASAQMSDLIGLMMGVHPTQEPQPDGSVIYYWHDQPLLEESLVIWRLDKNVFAVSDDGGQSWTGQTSDGTVIARTVHALQIHAQQVILSDGTTDLETALDEIETTPGEDGVGVVSVIQEYAVSNSSKYIDDEEISEDLVTYLPLNGTGKDEVTGTTATMTEITFVDGPKNKQAAYFNGTTSRMTLPNIGVTPKSFSVMVYVDQIPATNQIILLHDTSKIGLGFYGGNFITSACASSTPIASGANLNANSWNHIVVNYVSGDVQVFINGQETTYTGVKNCWTAGGSNLTIGFRDTASPSPFNGRLADIRVYNRVLDSEDFDFIVNGLWSPVRPEIGEGQFLWVRTVTTYTDGRVEYSEPYCVSGDRGDDGEDAITVHIDSVNGYIFKNTAVATTLVVTIIKGDQWIDNSTKLKAEFGVNAYLQWSEKKFGQLIYEDIALNDERLSDSGFMLTISAADIVTKSIFRCDLKV